MLDDLQKDAILTHWKRQFHSQPHQMDLQLRDSWAEKDPKGGGKGQGKDPKGSAGRRGWRGPKRGGAPQPAAEGKGQGAAEKGKCGRGGADGDQALGPNKTKVRSGKHSRWSRHLQREFGSKAITEVFVFTGRVTPGYMKRLDSASQPVEEVREDRRQLKFRVVHTKRRQKRGRYLEKKLARPGCGEETLNDEERALLTDFHSGRLLANQN